MATDQWKQDHVEEMRAYRRTWYNKNKKREQKLARERSRLARQNKMDSASKLKRWLREYKKTQKCNRCPESDWRCLDFHHKDGQTKEIEVSRAYLKGWSIERLLKEIAKCEVLCSNCHRKETLKL